MTVSCICCVWCSIAHGYSFVYFRLMGCVCFAVNFYFYVYRTCVWVCVFAIAYLLCILCASMCAHISAAEISNYLFILDLAEAYTIQGNFFQPRPCFLLPFLLSSLLLLSLRRYTFMPTSFLWKTLISDWIASVIHQHLWISNTIKTIRLSCTLHTNAWHLSVVNYRQNSAATMIFQSVTQNTTIF